MKKIFKKIIIVFGAVIVLVVGFFLIFQNNDFSLSENNTFTPEQEKTERQKENSGLIIETLTERNVLEGEKIKRATVGDRVIVHYIGKTDDGFVFENSYDNNRPFIFRIGDGSVILGWDIAVEGMKEGEKRKATIPPDLAFGAKGVPGIIPPNATIILEVELLSIQ